jgi:hypothetical protein
MISQLLFPEFVEVLEDIYALQWIRDTSEYLTDDAIYMLHIDNRQAWIESRLFALPRASIFLECCYLACYLCVYMMYSEIWQSPKLPVSTTFLPHSSHSFEESCSAKPPDKCTSSHKAVCSARQILVLMKISLMCHQDCSGSSSKRATRARTTTSGSSTLN